MNNKSDETMKCNFQRAQELINQALREDMPFLDDSFRIRVVDKIIAQLKLENGISLSEDVNNATALEYVKDYQTLDEMVMCALRYLNGIPRGEVSETQRKIDEFIVLRFRDVSRKYKDMTASECMAVTHQKFSEFYDAYLRGELKDVSEKDGE